MVNSERNEADLVRACLDGDMAAFELLVERYERPVFNAAYRLIGSREDARDITQTVFLKAYQNLRRYDPRHKFYSWIYRIAVNESLNLLSKKNRLETMGKESVSEAKGPEETLGSAETCQQVQEALMGLKSDYRVVIVLRHFIGCTYDDISRIIHVPLKTVKSRLFTARQLLKESLTKRGLI